MIITHWLIHWHHLESSKKKTYEFEYSLLTIYRKGNEKAKCFILITLLPGLVFKSVKC